MVAETRRVIETLSVKIALKCDLWVRQRTVELVLNAH